MVYSNFSDGYKKALINSENKTKDLGLKNLEIEDVFLEIIRTSGGWIKEIFTLYGIDEKLTIEIINKGLFNKKPENRKWVYAGMSNKLKDIILGSVKIAATHSKPKSTLEDFLISLIKNDTWLPNFLDYIGINATDLETNLVDLINLWTTDGAWKKESKKAKADESIEKLFGALADNIFSGLQEEGWNTMTPFDNNPNPKKKGKEDTNTPALDFFSNDLTQEAREGKIDKIIGRKEEIERLIAILNRKTKNNPVLVWEAWVGKTAIVEWLALRIIEWDVPFSMRDKRILSLDMSSLVAGTKFRWEFESRIKQVIEEASKIENEVILFIDEIHTMIGAGGWEGTLDASNILKPAMGRGKIRVIGATTLNEYQKYIEKDPALERRFQRILAEEPNQEIALEIVSGIKEIFEEYHNLNIEEAAVEEAVTLSIRYITDRYLPDKAIDLIDEACSLKSMKYNFDEAGIKKLKEENVKLQKRIEAAVVSQQYKKAVTLKQKQVELEEKIFNLKKKFKIPKSKRLSVKPEDIQRVLSMTTGVPISNLSKTEIDRIKKLPKTMKTKIIGQDASIEAITKAIMRSKTGIGTPHRPLGSFLFLGPTWVWKTEVVKVLAREFYGDESALIKIDMSEYSDKTSANKLIWASAGYIGYEEGGLLTEKVRKKPYSIVLFDEIEKGDPEIYNILLQILEEWVLTDNKGRKVNFKNTIIIMTSNIGQDEFASKAAQIGFDTVESEEEKIMIDYDKAKTNIVGNLTDYFSPEFVNRIDKIIVFNPLDKAKIKKIVKLQMQNLTDRLAEKDLTLTYDSKVLSYITKKVYNPEFGAREIRRFITDQIEDQIAEAMINSKTKKNYEIKVGKESLEVK